MDDPFTRWRAKRAARRPAVQPSAAPLIAEYKAANHINRIWALPILLGWAAAFLGVVIAAYVTPWGQAIADQIPTWLAVILMLSALGSIGFIFPILMRRRHWRLYNDRLEIEQRPLLWPFGRRIRAVVPLADIAAARHAVLMGDMRVVEVQTTKGRAYRLSPATLGSGRDAHRDDEGFDGFFQRIAATIRATGRELPEGGRLRTMWDTNFGLGLLGLLMLIAGAAILGCLYAAIVWLAPQFLAGASIAYVFFHIGWSLMRRKLHERRHG